MPETNEPERQLPGVEPAHARSLQTVDELLLEALDERALSVAHADQLCKQLALFAAEQGVGPEVSAAITELCSTRSDRFASTLNSLRRQYWQHQASLGKNHPALAIVEILIGICHFELRDFNPAIESFRSATIRFQQLENIDPSLFVRTLCLLAAAYRGKRNFSACRSAVKQAYRVVTACAAEVAVQCLVLEELAACMLAEGRYQAARDTYSSVVQSRASLTVTSPIDTVSSLIKLGLANFALHDLDAAEESLLRAAQVYQQSNLTDRALLVRLLDSLAGILRNQGQFNQADLLEERSAEVSGRLDHMCGHILYGTLVDEASCAEAVGDKETARTNYRKALCALEAQYEKRAADRLAILAKLFACLKPEQVAQRAGMLSEIEDALLAMFCGTAVGPIRGLRRVAVLFRVCGKFAIADSLDRLADSLPTLGAIDQSEHLMLTRGIQAIPKSLMILFLGASLSAQIACCTPALAQAGDAFAAAAIAGVPNSRPQPEVVGYLSNLSKRLNIIWSRDGHRSLKPVEIHVEAGSYRIATNTNVTEACDLVRQAMWAVPPPKKLTFDVRFQFSFTDPEPMHNSSKSTDSAPSPAQDVDFGPYMALLQHKVGSRWVMAAHADRPLRAVTVFKVHSGGELSDLRIDHGSGEAALDQQALQAVEGSAPFFPLPLGCPDSVDIHYTFDFQTLTSGDHFRPIYVIQAELPSQVGFGELD